MQSATPCQPRMFIVGYTRVCRLALAEEFSEQGFSVTIHADTELAMMAIDQQCPHVIVMDWIQPSSPTALEFMRRYGGLVPVLIMSTRAVLIDVVQSLRAGAADYIRMPCHFPELLARVERAQAASPTSRSLSIGNMSLDVGSGVAYMENAAVHLTARQARILAALIQCPDQAISRDTLMRVAGISDVKPTIVESYMKQLRQKHPMLRRNIRTKYGQGYAYCSL